jgi:hypothetical protein
MMADVVDSEASLRLSGVIGLLTGEQRCSESSRLSRHRG